MKIIDLLNAIAGTGIIPQRIYYDGNVYEYDGETQNYYKSLNFTRDWLIGEDITALLNDEVEIIKEPKKIEKLNDELGLFGDENMQKLIIELNYTRTIINKLTDEINNLKGKK